MKRYLLLAIFLSAGTTYVFAGNEKNIVTAGLKSATVYRVGAELVHTARASLQAGANDLVIDGISNRIDMNSVQVGSDNNLTIMSIEFSTDYLKPVQQSAISKRLEDSLEMVDKELSDIQVILKTDRELLDLLKANKEIRGTQTGLSVAELTKMMDYYKSKTLELQREMAQYTNKESRQLALIDRLRKQLAEEEKKNNRTVGKLLLQVFCATAATHTLTISYVTPNAFWNPAYDLRVDNINKPVNLLYKAKLVQTTGLDWKQVKLALATATPNQQGNAPLFQSWFLRYIDPVTRMEDLLAVNSTQSMLQGRVAGVQVQDKKQFSLNESIMIRGNQSLQSGGQPLYVINGVPQTAEVFAQLDPGAIKNMETLKDANATAVYGARAINGVVLVTLKDGMGDYVSVNDKTMNVVFDIDLPYDITSNGKEQNVTLKEYSIPAFFKYYAAPKLDKDAYLLGEITNWEQLNLLPGEANIIFEGTYIGKSFIDAGTTQDTLNLTLGRDKRVVIKREKMVDFSSVKFLGSNKKQTFTYELTVRNNKKEKIQLLLKDQYPLSTNKDIEVELLQSDGAFVKEELGVLTWKVELQPNETKKYRISYSVKYPKDKIVNIN